MVCKPAIMLMFDDGLRGFYENAYPLIKAKNMSATSYIIQDLVGGVGYMTSEQLQEINNENIDVGNHTKTHTDLTTLTQEQCETEFNSCKNYLDGLGLTRASKHIAYPAGKWNETVIDAMTNVGMSTGRQTKSNAHSITGYAGFPYLLSVASIANTDSVEDVKSFVDIAVGDKAVCVLLFHDIVDEDADLSTQWLTSDFAELIEYIDTIGLQTITIDEFYRLNSEAITVYHK
jgi:peptidoglycan/xylan/chitin deacetylase (PgdA/CDA1 family)